MKRMKLLLVGAVLAAVSGTSIAAVTVTKDRFTGVTTASMSAWFNNAARMGMFITINLDPNKPMSAQEVHIRYQSIGNQYEQCFATHWLADDQPVETPDAEYHGKTGEDELSTHMDVVEQTAPMSTIIKLADAQSAEFEICKDEFKLAPADSAQLKELVKKVEAAINAP